jgi:hypothetical protein
VRYANRKKRPVVRATRKMLELLSLVKIGHSSHSSREEGMCVMEAVAYITGDEHSDHPVCVAPSVTNCMIELNDSFEDEDRQRLKEYAPRVIGTFWNGRGGVFPEEKAYNDAFEMAIQGEELDPAYAENPDESLRRFENALKAAEVARDNKIEQLKAQDKYHEPEVIVPSVQEAMARLGPDNGKASQVEVEAIEVVADKP